MPSVILTDIIVRRLKSNDKQFELFDQKVRGLAIRVSSKGTKTFNFHYRMGGRSRRLTLGRYPSTSLKEARQKAQDASRQVSNGIDPQTEKLQARSTYGASLFSRVAAEFENHAKRNTRSWKETVRILANEFVSEWSNLQLQQISKRTIMSRVNEIASNNGPSAGNHAFQ